jgi:hypothetical protein
MKKRSLFRVLIDARSQVCCPPLEQQQAFYNEGKIVAADKALGRANFFAKERKKESNREELGGWRKGAGKGERRLLQEAAGLFLCRQC